MPTKIMIDSGAYSVYKSGKTIDLQEYIAFCKGFPEASCYVNLDVIPPTVMKADNAANQGWLNYKEMMKHLPIEKIVPVYHRGESVDWLRKYIDAGVKRIGIGGVAGEGDQIRLQYMKSIKDVLMDKTGKSVKKFHGFAIASHKAMQCFPWYSVDSTTWAKHSNVWHLLLPKTKLGKCDYSQIPLTILLSPRNKKGLHISNLSPIIKERVDQYLKDNNATLGKYELVKCSKGYKKSTGEYWLDSKKTHVVRVLEKGVCSDPDARLRINARFYSNVAKAVGIKEFYFSGMSYCPSWKDELKCVLLSFANLPKDYKQWVK